jgi:ribosomal protein S27AE
MLERQHKKTYVYEHIRSCGSPSFGSGFSFGSGTPEHKSVFGARSFGTGSSFGFGDRAPEPKSSLVPKCATAPSLVAPKQKVPDERPRIRFECGSCFWRGFYPTVSRTPEGNRYHCPKCGKFAARGLFEPGDEERERRKQPGLSWLKGLV